MSATQLAAFIVAAVVAAALAFAAGALVYAAHLDQEVRFGATALALGVLAIVVLGVGYAVTTPDVTPDLAPESAWSNRCPAGTYDNGGERYNGPVCIPWKGQMP